MSEDKKVVLLIEDNPRNRKLETDLLEVAGYTVVEAEDAETGIQIAREKHPALILMDVQLPHMDGLTAVELIKNDEDLKTIPCVLITSSATREDIERYEKSPADGYLTKPIDTRSFAKEVGSYITN